MADEIQWGIFLSVQKGSQKRLTIPFLKQYADMAGNVYRQGTQTIGTAKENIDKPTGMGTIGFVAIVNLHATASVEIGDDADAPSMKLLAGQGFIGPWGATNVSCKASAELDVEFLIIEL